MKLFFLILIVSSAHALTDKSKIIVTPVEEKIENTTEKSKLRVLETGKSVVLHHREPMMLPDGRIIELNYFSHKTTTEDGPRRASVGLKISGDTPELIVLHQDLDKNNKQKLSRADSAVYTFKLDKMVYDDQIELTITPK